MFQTLLITFREGLEAFLIVAVATLYLRKMERQALVSAVRAGLGVAIVGSIALGILLAKLGNMSPAWEGALALVAAGAIVWCVTHMLKVGKVMSQEVSVGIGQAMLDDGRAWWSVFLFTIFMVGREGVESAAMLSSLAGNADMQGLFAGGLIGLVAAASIALLWSKFGRQVNLSRFFSVTAVFMLALAALFTLKAFYEFTEVDLLPLINNSYWHAAARPYVKGDFAQIVSVLLVLAPTLWLMLTHWLDQPKQSIRA